MKQIAILTCRHACDVCTGASCLRAWNARERGFSPYAGEDVSLAAFFHCNGCGSDPQTDSGMLEKLDRLKSIGVDVVHTGVCTVTERDAMTWCPTVQKIAAMLRDRGIQVVQGTH